MQLRTYTADDKSACLAIFDSNTPPYFGEHERDEFASFLDQSNSPYFVVTDQDEHVIACGGFWHIVDTPVAILTWGMVNRSQHQQRIGSFLLTERLEHIKADPSISIVKIVTSQYTYGFFEQAGFVITEIVEHGFGPNLHKYHMQKLF